MSQSLIPDLFGPWERPVQKPILSPNPSSRFICPVRKEPVAWEKLHTFNPAAVVKDGRMHLLYRAEDDSGIMEVGGHCSRLGLATSDDGVSFHREPSPVLFPDMDSQTGMEWDGGCEDPRLVEMEDGTYLLTYTRWNRKTPTLGLATSRDLRIWTKHGSPFTGTFAVGHSKSAAIVTRLVQSGKEEPPRVVATKVNGRYLMYWGEGEVALASSTDGLHWENHGRVLERRPGHFDSQLAEGGPQALLTTQGIWLMYNGINADVHGDPNLPAGMYAAGEAILDPEHPIQVTGRTAAPVFKPEFDFERTGQYVAGTTFVEGLALFKGRWFLYYGCADSHVGVAVAEAGPGLKRHISKG